jgi:hypothetical protein
VPRNDGQAPRFDVTFNELEVGAADRAGREAEPQLSRPGLGKRSLDEAEWSLGGGCRPPELEGPNDLA